VVPGIQHIVKPFDGQGLCRINGVFHAFQRGRGQAVSFFCKNIWNKVLPFLPGSVPDLLSEMTFLPPKDCICNSQTGSSQRKAERFRFPVWP
jgi:hypothetical protein